LPEGGKSLRLGEVGPPSGKQRIDILSEADHSPFIRQNLRKATDFQYDWVIPARTKVKLAVICDNSAWIGSLPHMPGQTLRLVPSESA
jgi:hypothetical protein